jgi:hypothetical protein
VTLNATLISLDQAELSEMKVRRNGIPRPARSSGARMNLCGEDPHQFLFFGN